MISMRAEKSIFDMVKKGAEYGLDNKALIYNDTYLTYQELLALIKERAAILKEKGIVKCSKVGILLDNPYEFVINLFAVSYLNGVVMPIYFNTGSEKIKDIVKINEINFIITTKELIYPQIYEEEVSNLKIYFNSAVLDKELSDVSLILFTSGTTNSPKAIMLTEGNIFSNVLAISNYLKLMPKDNILLIKNLCHASTLIGELLVGIRNGCTVIMTNKLPIAGVILRLIQKNNITVFFAVPTILKEIMTCENLKVSKLDNLRIINFYGAPMSALDIKTLANLLPKCNLIYSYGLTEASPRVTYIERKNLILNPSSCGVPIGGTEIKIVDDKNQEVEPLHEGEIMIYGPNVMKGYYRDLRKTSDIIRSGWLHTGDIGYIDEKGLLYIRGRKDNMIISFGKNIYLEEIEKVLGSMPGIMEVLAQGNRRENGTIEIVSYIVLSDKKLSINDILTYCVKHLENYKVPKKIIVVDNLERTSSGKIKRTVIT